MNAVTKRRSLSPTAGMPQASSGMHAMRRGTARREVTERVTLRGASGDASGAAGSERVLEGWALNASRGGLRAILEEKVELGQEFDVLVGDAGAIARRGRIVWLQEELDGVIVGVEYTGLSGIHRAADGAHEGPRPGTREGADGARAGDDVEAGPGRPDADASAEVAVVTVVAPGRRGPDDDDAS
jgi:hypothetical protein